MMLNATATPEDLADWLELRAVESADRNSSIQDLVRALRRCGTTDALPADDSSDDDDPTYTSDYGAEKSQSIAEDAFSEVEDRAAACTLPSGGSFYPFQVANDFLEVIDRNSTPLYLFLLLLSVFGKDAGPPGVSGEDLFEDISAEALKAYFGGSPHARAQVFGFPRRVLPPGFRNAIDALCKEMGEGGSCRERPSRRNQKDAKLDIVAWREFLDRRHGKLIGFGQCATGQNWQDKLTELLPDNFCRKWLVDAPTVNPVRAFFLPFRPRREYWIDTCFDAGILFDRCRISSVLEAPPQDILDRCRVWIEHVLGRRTGDSGRTVQPSAPTQAAKLRPRRSRTRRSQASP